MEPLQVRVKTAAVLLSMCVKTVYRLIEAGEIHAVGTGRLKRISMASLRDYIQRNTHVQEAT